MSYKIQCKRGICNWYDLTHKNKLVSGGRLMLEKLVEKYQKEYPKFEFRIVENV